MAQDIIANTLSVDNIEAKSLKINGNTIAAKASATTLGGIKVGANLAIDSNGVLSASGGGSSSGPKIHLLTDDSGIIQLDSIIEGDIILNKTVNGVINGIEYQGNYYIKSQGTGDNVTNAIYILSQDENTIYARNFYSTQANNYIIFNKM